MPEILHACYYVYHVYIHVILYMLKDTFISITWDLLKKCYGGLVPRAVVFQAEGRGFGSGLSSRAPPIFSNLCTKLHLY